jgi:hypothetical protein
MSLDIVKILPCTCKNEGQDKLHGPGMRVFNRGAINGPTPNANYTCTVCLKKVNKYHEYLWL